MKKPIALGVASAAVLAVTAFVFSPMSCACVTPLMAFRAELLAINPSLGLRASQMSMAVLEETFAMRVGMPGAEVVKPVAFEGNPCRKIGNESVVCKYYLEQGLIVERGWKVHYSLREGKVHSVTVSSAYRFRPFV
jgi:hypothetical protein